MREHAADQWQAGRVVPRSRGSIGRRGVSAYKGACQCGGPRLIRGVIHVSTEVCDTLVDVGFWHIGNGNEGVSTLYAFPLRPIDADFTVAMAEELMANATLLSQAGQGIPVRAYHRDTRAGSPLTGLPRGEILD